ncbi:hypothetical protein KBG31_00250 [Patescibacteria group bacterium]|nr:hypothetical protein [Patescibacteria group bacterium]HOM78315.1 hypothetical protein [bacterium]
MAGDGYLCLVLDRFLGPITPMGIEQRNRDLALLKLLVLEAMIKRGGLRERDLQTLSWKWNGSVLEERHGFLFKTRRGKVTGVVACRSLNDKDFYPARKQLNPQKGDVLHFVEV